MIQDCQQLEQRIQELMDCRIDPETDEAVLQHCAQCAPCSETLLSFSLIHSKFLNDSDSMKIKLAHLGLHEIAIRNSQQTNHGRVFAVAASLAAMLLLLATLSYGSFFRPAGPAPVARHFEPAVVQSNFDSASQDPLASIQQIKRSMDPFEIYSYSSELPGLHSLKALSVCFDWLQKSWLNKIGVKAEPNESDPNNFGSLPGFNPELRYIESYTLASCS